MDAGVVVAIDFGTTYSGWAFQYRHEYDREPLKISARQWQGSGLSNKAPTCILIKSDRTTTHSFGYEAESKYAEICEENEQDQWFFFKRFKMMLFKDKGMKRSDTLEDASGKKLPAMTVFSLSIQYLKADVLIALSKHTGTPCSVTEVHWVLTVPAIWNDASKQFMREAAQKAGITGGNLTVCLEPEAASIYCRQLPVSKITSKEEMSLAQFSSGTKYMVLDAGGGTVDITVHEVTDCGELKELQQASGGAWGGTKVDEAYEEFLSSVVGAGIMSKFKSEHLDDFIEVFRDFEVKKRKVAQARKENVTIRMPPSLSTLCELERGVNLKELFLKSRFKSKVKVLSDKIRLDTDIFLDFFKPTIYKIVSHVKDLLKKPSVNGCSAILMVGGFSDSPMLQETVKKSFGALRIIVPEDAGLAVLKGAVLFGHEPTTITERICKFTYGHGTSHKSNDSCKHPKGRVGKDTNGNLRCYDIFSIHVKAGQSVKLNEEQNEIVGTPVTDDQTAISIPIYSSSSSNPHLTTEDGCKSVGKLTVPVSDTSSGRNHKFGISFIFGGTEIVVKVVDKESSDEMFESVNFLG